MDEDDDKPDICSACHLNEAARETHHGDGLMRCEPCHIRADRNNHEAGLRIRRACDAIITLVDQKLIDQPTVPMVKPLVEKFYKLDGNEAGGYALHCVLDDGNVEDSFVDSAFEDACNREDWVAAGLAAVLREMSETQRREVRK